MEVFWKNIGEGNIHWIETEEKFTQVRLLSSHDGVLLKHFIGVFAKIEAAHWITDNKLVVVGRNNK